MGQWFAHLVPFSHARAKSTYPEKSQINSYFKKAGLKKMFEFMPSSSIIGEKYDDEEIFLKNEQNWMMDSVLSSADDKELNHAKEWVRQLKSTGKLREFYDNHNLVDKLGCGTVVILMKE